MEAADIGPYVPSLRSLERDIHYPLDDGREHFFIDHGEAYHPFFSGMGHARFLLALDGDEVAGSIAGVVKQARVGSRTVNALYLCDLKVRASHRGRGLGRRLFRHGLKAILTTEELRSCRLIYGAAMRGARGDVMRSARGTHLLRLARSHAELAVYFAQPSMLQMLDVTGCPANPPADGMDLGTDSVSLGVSTAGRKDLRLVSTGKPWPLVHLPASPAHWGTSLAHHLRRCGEELAGSDALACFALDVRLVRHIDWLAMRGLSTGTRCAVYALMLAWPRRAVPWVHVPTSEI